MPFYFFPNDRKVKTLFSLSTTPKISIERGISFRFSELIIMATQKIFKR